MLCFATVFFFLSDLNFFSSPLSVSSPLSRPGPAAPSRSCSPQPGSSSPTPQSSMPLSSPTPWAAHSLSPTGGEQHSFHVFSFFLSTAPSQPLLMSEYCGLQFPNPPFLLRWIKKSNRLTCITLKLQNESTLPNQVYTHNIRGKSVGQFR